MEVDFVLNSAKCTTTIDKYAYLDSDDPNTPTLAVKVSAITANPEQKLNYMPTVVDFGEVRYGNAAKFTLSLKNDDSAKVVLTVPYPPPAKYIKKVDIAKRTLSPGESTEIEFTLSDKAPVGEFLTSISLEVKDKPSSRITISIKGDIVEE